MLDPRGPRFAAALTTLVVLVAMTFSSGWVMLFQAVVFGLTALAPRFGPYGLVYKTFVAPRLSRPEELEPLAPVRFAQTVGLVFAVVSGFGYLLGAPVVGLVAAAFALAAAFLNAAFGLCLGCEVYLAYRRLAGRPIASRIQAR
jgi:hypothetical protein